MNLKSLVVLGFAVAVASLGTLPASARSNTTGVHTVRADNIQVRLAHIRTQIARLRYTLAHRHYHRVSRPALIRYTYHRRAQTRIIRYAFARVNYRTARIVTPVRGYRVLMARPQIRVARYTTRANW